MSQRGEKMQQAVLAVLRQNHSPLSACEEKGAPTLLEELSSISGRTGFMPTRHIIEVHGLCASCGSGDVHP